MALSADGHVQYASVSFVGAVSNRHAPAVCSGSAALEMYFHTQLPCACLPAVNLCNGAHVACALKCSLTPLVTAGLPFFDTSVEARARLALPESIFTSPHRVLSHR